MEPGASTAAAAASDLEVPRLLSLMNLIYYKYINYNEDSYALILFSLSIIRSYYINVNDD